MDRKGYDIVVPRKKPDQIELQHARFLLRFHYRQGPEKRLLKVQPEPFLDFDSGYIKRARHILPRQGSRKPWRVCQDYLQDMLTIRFGRIADDELKFGARGGEFDDFASLFSSIESEDKSIFQSHTVYFYPMLGLS